MEQLSSCPSFDIYAHLANDAVSRALGDSDDLGLEFEFEFPTLSANPDVTSPVFNRDLTRSSAAEKRSRRWGIRDLLLRRSNSEGSGKDSASAAMVLKVKAKDKEEVKKKKGSENVSAHEKFYVRKRKLKEEDRSRRRSYLPYRQGLVGFFGLGNCTPSLLFV